MKKITSFLLFTTSLFLCVHESQSNSFCTTNTSQAISTNELWREGKEELSKEKLEQSIRAGFKPNDREMYPLLEKAAKNNQRNIIEWLFTQPHGISINQYHVDTLFSYAAYNNHRDLMEWLLTQPHGIPLPSQRAINNAFVFAALKNHRDLMEWLLARPYGIPLPDEYNVNLAFSSAAENNHRNLMEWLLTQPRGIPFINQEGVNKAFSLAAYNNHRDLMEWLLTRPYGIPLPDQDGATRALNSAKLADNYTLMEWILTPPQGIPLPNQYKTVELYRELCSRRYVGRELARVLIRMDLLVPEQERRDQGRMPIEVPQNEPRQIIPNRAMAFEVHNYANTLVSESSHSASASATGTGRKLSDIIFNKIYSRIQGIVPVEIDLVPLRLQSAVEHIYAGQPEKINLATQALDNSYGLQDAKLYLRTVMTFLDHLPESELKFDLWFKGFIEESIEAYKNSQNKLSCVKGIQERILTGLRGVDKELDQIFKQAEASLLMTNYINQQFNVYNEGVQHNIAIMLKKNGITPQSPLIDAQRALENDLRSKLKEYQAEIPADIQESIPEIIEIFGNLYDEKIKPLLRTPIHPELSFKQEETSKRSG